jgi:ribonuclease P protein component
MTLSRRFRLSGPTAFSSVFQQAVVSADPCFKVLGRQTGQENSRLGMAVSRQVDRRAVERNRLKRIIRESFRQHYLSNSKRPPVDIVVLPRREAVSICNRRLFDQLSRHWQRIDKRVSIAPAVSTPREIPEPQP